MLIKENGSIVNIRSGYIRIVLCFVSVKIVLKLEMTPFLIYQNNANTIAMLKLLIYSFYNWLYSLSKQLSLGKEKISPYSPEVVSISKRPIHFNRRINNI